MHKKIIYLLSLLMALSLVFAACKKPATAPDLGGLPQPPPDSGTGEDLTGDNGLFGKYEDIPNDTHIADTGVFVTTDGNYYRNPVVVAREDGTLFVFAEKRWRSKGSGNDVGIDGINTTDVIYKVSKNGGYKFDTQEYTVGKKASGPKNSHGAPAIFVKDNNIVVVASSGSGIGRTSKYASEKDPSKIEYISGTITDSSISWNGDWKEIALNSGTIAEKIKNVSAGGSGNKKFDQYGTPPSRGFVDNSGNMYLAIVLAQQGTLNDTYELMGRMTLKASINNPGTWTVVEEPVGYTDNNTVKLGPWKETKLIGVSGSTLNHLIVPSPWTSESLKPKVLGTDTGNVSLKSSSIKRTSIPASEGSPGFYNTTDKWFGETKYTLSKDGSGKVTITGTGNNMSILAHVQQTASQLHLYILDNSFKVQGKGWKLDDVGKSSSVDMLPDGTIVVAAEKGGESQNYFIRLLRYSQPYIVSKTK